MQFSLSLSLSAALYLEDVFPARVLVKPETVLWVPFLALMFNSIVKGGGCHRFPHRFLAAVATCSLHSPHLHSSLPLFRIPIQTPARRRWCRRRIHCNTISSNHFHPSLAVSLVFAFSVLCWFQRHQTPVRDIEYRATTNTMFHSTWNLIICLVQPSFSLFLEKMWIAVVFSPSQTTFPSISLIICFLP